MDPQETGLLHLGFSAGVASWVARTCAECCKAEVEWNVAAAFEVGPDVSGGECLWRRCHRHRTVDAAVSAPSIPILPGHSCETLRSVAKGARWIPTWVVFLVVIESSVGLRNLCAPWRAPRTVDGMSKQHQSKHGKFSTCGPGEPIAPSDALTVLHGKWWSVVPDRPTSNPSDFTVGRSMVVVRESNMFDLVAFSGMIHQVLEPLHGRVPGADVVLGLSGRDADIMRNDAKGMALRTSLGSRALFQDGRPYGYVFETQGTMFVFAMTSAFSDTEDFKNHFTEDLIDEMRRFRPVRLITGPSTRLVRRKDLGEILGKAAGDLHVRVYTKETPDGLDLKSTTGSTSWTFLCLLAEQDLRYTVTRLITGKIMDVRKGHWLAGAGAVPVGFTLAGDDKKRVVVGDEGDIGKARLMIDLAAKAGRELDLPADQRTITPTTIVEALSEIGATMRSNKRSNKGGRPVRGAPLRLAGNHKSVVLSLLAPLDVYSADGKLVRAQELPIPGLTRHDVHGHDIHKRDPDDPSEKGVILFEWTFPKPVDEQGAPTAWATPDDLSDARRYYQSLQRPTGGIKRIRTWPLIGVFEGEHDGQRYKLVYKSSGYAWRRGPSGEEPVGKFDATALTTRLVEATLARLEELAIDPANVPLHIDRPKVSLRGR